jgi:hypothetical protein
MLRAASVLALCLCAACASPQKPAPEPAEQEEAPPFQWALPDGWRPETIPFPLDFAPDIQLQGVEELRFPPGMFKPDAPTYWSYAFVWWLEGEPVLGEAELEDGLNRYFAGLTRAVGEKKHQFDAGRFRVDLTSQTGAVAKEGHTVQAYAGKADLYDAFATGKELTLNVEIWVWECPVAHRRAALFLASPQSRSAPVWASLEQRRDEMLCHKY